MSSPGAPRLKYIYIYIYTSVNIIHKMDELSWIFFVAFVCFVNHFVQRIIFGLFAWCAILSTDLLGPPGQRGKGGELLGGGPGAYVWCFGNTWGVSWAFGGNLGGLWGVLGQYLGGASWVSPWGIGRLLGVSWKGPGAVLGWSAWRFFSFGELLSPQSGSTAGERCTINRTQKLGKRNEKNKIQHR